MSHSPHKQPQNHKCVCSNHTRICVDIRGESRRVAMASNSLFSSVTPCQQNFFWGECCEKLFSFHCGSASGHTGVKLRERVDNQRRTRARTMLRER
ncbi:hypothetical protein PO909_011328 [Leuciscus waleckii]